MNNNKKLSERNLKEILGPVFWCVFGFAMALLSVKAAACLLGIKYWEAFSTTFATFVIFALFMVVVLLLWGVVEDKGDKIYPFKFINSKTEASNKETTVPEKIELESDTSIVTATDSDSKIKSTKKKTNSTKTAKKKSTKETVKKTTKKTTAKKATTKKPKTK